MDRWGGAPAIKLMAIVRNLANRVTTDRKGNPGSGPLPGYFAVTWHGNMWGEHQSQRAWQRIPFASGRLLVGRLSRRRRGHRGRSLRAIAAELAALGYVGPSGKPYHSKPNNCPEAAIAGTSPLLLEKLVRPAQNQSPSPYWLPT
jgi:hypothetical protein